MLVFIIAISLSMDAFSLTLAYGTLKLTKKDINLLSFVVGIYHFFMPLLGMFLGKQILKFLPINCNFLVFAVLLIIGIEMIIETFKSDETVKKMKFIEIILFGLAVSIDSFSVGIGLKVITDNFILSSLIFSVVSFSFTYLGLLIGYKLSNIIGRLATLFGGIVLIVIGICYLV